MSKIYYTISLLLFSLTFSFGQSEKINDYNQDGIKDTLRNYVEGNYFFARYIDGKTNQSYDFRESDFNRSEFINFVSIPKELMQAENEVLLDSLKEDLFPYTKFEKSIPGLDWLLTAYQSDSKMEEGYFSQFIDVPLQWHYWDSKSPEVVLYKVKTDTLDLPNYFYPDTLPKYGLLFYYGHNHVNDLHRNPWYDFIFKKKDIEILKTKHGIILRKKYDYAWIFHTNGSLTGRPSKLRWKSLEKILIHKHYIFIHHVSPVLGENRIFIINIKNGNIGRLNLESDFSENSKNCFKMEIGKDYLQLESIANDNCMKGNHEGEILKFKLKNLFRSLKKLDKKM